ncbi:hypothetical protein CKO28_08580 [Rhodovibrio sodomensis]|uniref:Dicarboxylate transport domain-containing protein n=1 Tax=Rhodovibrio sodomensis TaxID=1088 RepID=A0ABS1DDT3_9PROT|nr:YdbH domain-containing protein [Rhodovibrio sodomensis]MBK1668091.1 hypothetical protein [Rhodovibrio sodomensis]
MRRWLLWLPLSVLTVVGLAIGALLLARTEIAELAARELLERRGFPNAQMTVARLTHERLELTDVDLGPGAPEAARIAVVYTLSGLLDGRIERLEVDGPQVTVDLTADQPLGGLLGALPSGPAEAAAGPATVPRLPEPVPTVLLRNAAVEVRGARATVQMSLSGRIDRRDGETRATLHGQVRTPHTTADVSLDARQLGLEPRLFVEVTGRSELARLPWPDALAHRPAGGTLDFSLTGELQFPAPGSALTLDNLVRPASRLALQLSVERLELPGLAHGVAARSKVHLAVSDGALVARLVDPATLSTDGVQAARLTELGLPQDAAQMLARFRTVALTPWTGGHEVLELHAVDAASGTPDGAAWRWNGRASLLAGGAQMDEAELRVRAAATGTLARGFGLQVARVDRLEAQARRLAYGPHRLDRASFTGQATIKPGGLTLDGTLHADGISIVAGAQRVDGIRVAAPLAVRATAAGTRLTLSDAATVTMRDVPDTRPVVLDTPVKLTVTGLEATAAAGQVQASFRVAPGTLDATLLRRDAGDLTAHFAPGPISFALESLTPLKARVGFDGGTLKIPGERIAAREVSAEFKQGYGNPVALITLGHLTHGGDPAALAPSLVWMQLHATGDQGWRVVGQQIVKGTAIRLPFAARTDADARNGQATIGPVNARFVPEGLQPGRISPWLGARVRNAEGQLGMRGELAWTPAGLTSSATLAATDLGFTADAVTVSGLTGTVFFDSLTPPDTPANQRLTADAVTAGVPLENVEIVFDVDSPEGGAPVLRLARAGGTLAGGDVFVRDAELRLGAKTNRVTVQVRDVSMSKLVGLLEVEGLRADGTLAGEIPLRFGPGGLQIDRGKLAAVDNGRIQLEFGAAQDTLAGQGQSVGLMVRALQDFHYDVLSLTVTRPKTGNLALGITMQGNNPDVLDGYPFKFNIDLTGDLEPILAALQTGRRLTTDLLQRALENRGAGDVQIQ